MRKYFVFILTILIIQRVKSQDNTLPLNIGTGNFGMGTSLLQDYEAVGVNPANLGIYDDESSLFSIGVGDVSGFLHSDAINGNDLVTGFFTNKTFTLEDKVNAALDFASKGVTSGAMVQPFALAVQIPKVGGFAFNWRQNFSTSFKLNPFMADLAFTGINSTYFDTVYHYMGDLIAVADSASTIGDLLNGTYVKYNWTQEFDFSFGRKLIETDALKLYAGATYKMMQGIAILDAEFNNGDATGYSATTPFMNVDYGNVSLQHPVGGSGIKPVGKGTGFDVGVNARILDLINVAASVVDIGSITWTGNSMTLQNVDLDTLKNFSGWSSFDFSDNLGDVFDASGLYSWAAGVDRKISLPTKLRVGASVEVTKMLKLSVDAVQPFSGVPGNLENTLLAFGIHLQPTSAIGISTGVVSGGQTDVDVPFGLSFGFGPLKVYQCGIATGDILSFLSHTKPTRSIALNLIRIQF